MPPQDPDQRMMLYFADPMCSWCWGFAPVITEIAAQFGEAVPIQLVMGGLRAGNDKPMTDKDKAYVRGHWEHVQERTGQEFDFAFFDREGFVYDTEPACRAVVTARSFDTGLGLAMLKRVSEAFYAHGEDTTDRDTLVALADLEGLDAGAFGQRFDSKDAEMLTKMDFGIASQIGVAGFPTLLAGTANDGFRIVTQGYQPLDAIVPPIAEWLGEERPAAE